MYYTKSYESNSLIKGSPSVFLVKLCSSDGPNFCQHHFIESKSLSFNKRQHSAHLFNNLGF